MASGYPADHPAHISLITKLNVSSESSLDSEQGELAILIEELQRVADCTSPFKFVYLSMDPYKPFGKGAGCVALVVRNLPSLTNLIKALDSR